MYPKDFFDGRQPREELGRCFVLMPFAPAFDPVYRAIAEVVESEEVGFTCIRADELFGGGHIMEDVLKEIARAEIIIADVSTRNPNVFYELGVVHMVKKIDRVLILTQNMADVPFDIQQLRVMPYASTDLPTLQRGIASAFEAVASESFVLVGRDGDDLQSPRRLLGHDRWIYSLRIPELYVEPDFAKFRLSLSKSAIGHPPETVLDEGQALEVGESLELSGAAWALTLARVQDGQATFRVAKRSERMQTAPPDAAPISATQRELLWVIADAGASGIYIFELMDSPSGLELDRETIVYRAKDLAASGYITIQHWTDLHYTVTDLGRTALD